MRRRKWLTADAFSHVANRYCGGLHKAYCGWVKKIWSINNAACRDFNLELKHDFNGCNWCLPHCDAGRSAGSGRLPGEPGCRPHSCVQFEWEQAALASRKGPFPRTFLFPAESFPKPVWDCLFHAGINLLAFRTSARNPGPAFLDHVYFYRRIIITYG